MGTTFGLASASDDAIAMRASSLRTGPLRVAVVANVDAAQAEAAVRAVDRWVARHPGDARNCPAVIALPPVHPGTYSVASPAGAPSEALLAVPFGPADDAARAAAQWTAAALDGPDGLLAHALGPATGGAPQAPLAQTWSAGIVGWPRSPAMVVRLTAEDALLDPAVAQTRALLDRLRQGALREEDRSACRVAPCTRYSLRIARPACAHDRPLAGHGPLTGSVSRRAPRLCGRNPARRRARHRRDSPAPSRDPPVSRPRTEGQESRAGAVALTTHRASRDVVEPPSEPPWFRVGEDRVRLLRDGTQAFPAMLEAIASAERGILLEMYWVGPDAVGERFRDALVERARAGVKVSVIYDAVGSMGITPAWWRPLFAAGGRALEYHSISPLDPRFRLERVELRDHRKLLVVDTQRGFTGGINLAAAWLPPAEGGVGWRDDVIEVRGDAAQELRTLFYRTWRKLTREAAPLDVRPLSRKRTRPVWVLASQWRSRRSIHREYVVRIRHAKDRVDIANSYFVPDRRVRAALFGAVRRGVRVRVLVPAKSDVPIVQFAVEALFDTLLRHGIEIWALPGTMLHAKTAIIDEAFTTIGSYNLDERSWRKNLEVNLAVEDKDFARHVRGWFDRDLDVAVRIELNDWRERSLTRRGFEWAAFAMRRLW